MLKTGDKIPDILGLDENGNEISASNFLGRGLIIYFYPKDNTPGCSAEACSLRDSWQHIKQMGYEVLGVSKDSQQSHRKFVDKLSLPFLLIADTDHKLCEEFGVWRLKKMAGREYMGIVRTTFVVDADGVITDIIEKVNTKQAAEQLIKILKSRAVL